MEVQYRQSFLRDLKKLKGQPVYDRIHELVFNTLPEAGSLRDIANVRSIKGSSNRYRIRIGNYCIGVEVEGDSVEVMRILHRRDFYRYFP